MCGDHAIVEHEDIVALPRQRQIGDDRDGVTQHGPTLESGAGGVSAHASALEVADEERFHIRVAEDRPTQRVSNSGKGA